ncbi:helix-turn-helix transcriptional regulator [Spiractinospora alimapuensis]|uniref:helix-turn-helix domain-containing protein n=1 Tax=Spiractinospora alimapuensis TaxID=2820884 RepID=UPI001F400E2A|nr:helix-turn-helix transcriptional regulator [Spiractinospora alimapuensis]QVQ53368.1 helix-turn-helix transcriptional regulator [Spiractinospora alimapuensis]
MKHHEAMGDRYWKRWGAELRTLRERADVSQAALGRVLNIARPTLGAYERGERRPRRQHAVEADEFLSAGGVLVQMWEEAQEGGEVPQEWRDFERTELQALTIRGFHPTLVPGLLQTRDYVEAILRNGGWNKAQADRLAQERADRLKNLEDTALTFVINEEVLRRGHGSSNILLGQLDYLHDLMEHRRIRLQIIPLSTLQHPCPDGAFRLMLLRNGTLIGHEQYLSGVNVVQGARAEQLVELFGHLQGEARSPQESMQLVDTIRRELR